VDWTKLHTDLETNEGTLIVVNAPGVSTAVFEAGELPIPKNMIHALLVSMTNEKTADLILPAVGGCTLKDVTDFIRLTTARDKKITPQGIVQTRKEFFSPQKGLTYVDTANGFYQPPQELQDWIEAERDFFLNSEDVRLRARGILADGPPGTGKTEAAKYIANQFGVPLFRLDLAGAKNKYVGESEENLSRALARLDHEEPCVVLVDEVEKLYGDHQEGGTATSMLSQLLWWLQEHKSRVLTIMTTNNKAALPKELYRPGRVDKVMNFEGLPEEDAAEFIVAVLGTFVGIDLEELDESDVETILAHAKTLVHPDFADSPHIAQGTLVQGVIQAVKTLLS
jgi:hypothetical protein